MSLWTDEEKRQFSVAEGRLHHDAQRAFQARMHESADTFALEGLRAAQWLSGGAVVGFLPFVAWASGYGVLDIAKDRTQLVAALGGLGVAAILSALATLFAYLSQSYANWAACDCELQWHPPYVEPTNKSKLYSKKSRRCALTAGVLICVAYGAIIAAIAVLGYAMAY